jgi:hypothetical protein
MRSSIIVLAVSGALITSGIAVETSTLIGAVTHDRDGDTIHASIHGD